MLCKYDYPPDKWDSLLKNNLKIGQVISTDLGISPYSEWIVVEPGKVIPGYSHDMVLCKPKGINKKGLERHFPYSNIAIIF